MAKFEGPNQKTSQPLNRLIYLFALDEANYSTCGTLGYLFRQDTIGNLYIESVYAILFFKFCYAWPNIPQLEKITQ